MMVLDRKSGEAVPRNFSDIISFLRPGDLVVRNNTRVRRGRFFARKLNPGEAPENGAKFEILLLEPAESGIPGEWNVMLRPGKRAKEGLQAALLTREGNINTRGDIFTVTGKNPDGTGRIRFSIPDIDTVEEYYGHIPLPPYINREDEPEDAERYQTVYAEHTGAVAAPTAGLHFTDELFNEMRNRGVGVAEVTLHVGAGTFKPVEAAYAEEHKMHFEEYFLDAETAEAVNATHRNGGRVMAIGTTSVRVLESCVDKNGIIIPGHGKTDIFLYPPYRPRAVDMLLTNFHLPKSTLLMLVSCFAERAKVMAAYELAKSSGFRFYSYGDCMLLK